MEACTSVEKEVDRVVLKFLEWDKSKNGDLDEILVRIRELKDELKGSSGEEKLNGAQAQGINQIISKTKKVTGRVTSSHRDMHSTVSKVGKIIDRTFVSDFNSVSREDLFSEPDKTQDLHQVILQHFYRQGRLDISDSICKEADITEYQSMKEPFLELNSILESLHNKDLSPALNWAFRHRIDLNARIKFGSSLNNVRNDGSRGSPLELRLHRLRFIELLHSGQRIDAIVYARTYFPQFVGVHEKEVQSLMGALMYPNLAESPYAHLLNPSLWHDICDHFVRDACALMGLSIESPLSVVINAGCQALPALLNIKQVMLQRQVSGSLWNAKDELPIEIDLGDNCRYHSVFACPILRQQTSDLNPPLRLTCGHCISRDALSKLSTGQKIKCPLCPVEQNPNDARQITF